MQDKFLLLGVPPGGLFLSRQLRKAYPSALIYAVGDHKRDIGRFSNTLDCFLEVEKEERVLEVVQEAYKDMGEGEIRAFFCSNPMLETIVGRFPEVFDFLIFENSYETYKVIVDKDKSSQLCNRLGICTPLTLRMEEVNPNNIVYPIVIKPLIKSEASGVNKCAFIKSMKDYLLYSEKISQLGIEKKNLLCQQYIEGDNRWEYGYGGYFIDGKPIIDICFHQFIQVPQGLCCYSREVTDNDLAARIRALIQPFLTFFHYTGLLEFDIKQDALTSQLFLLDINPRPWRSSDMLAAKLRYSTIFNPIPTFKKVIWRYPYRELFACKNSKNVSYSVCKSMTKGYETTTKYMMSDRFDKKPSRIQLKEDIMDFLKRL